MTSVQLPYTRHGVSAKRETVRFKDSFRRERNEEGSTSTSLHKMNVLHSITSFLRKQKKDKEPSFSSSQQQLSELSYEEEEEQPQQIEKRNQEFEVSEHEAVEALPFERSTLRQSVKRAIGWKKSQRKAVNKRKKENIQNSKLFAKWEPENEDTEQSEFYEDKELDVVVVAGGVPEEAPRPDPTPAKSRIPKRKQSMKRPAVSLKSTAFFSQSVSAKRDEVVKPVPARTNKASALREEAIKKKLESTPTPQTPGTDQAPRRRKSRTSFRTKKGISRRPLQKKNIKPVENKASQLRAKQHLEEEDPKQPTETKLKTDCQHNSEQNVVIDEKQAANDKQKELRESGRFASSGVKTPSPMSENVDTSNISLSMRTSISDHSIKLKSAEPVIPAKTTPHKPQRNKDVSSPPSPNTPKFTRKFPQTSWALHSSDSSIKKYAGKSEKTIPSNIPKPRVNVSSDPSKELVFIPLDSASLPLPENKLKIDEVRRKRKMQRPVSNIFEKGSIDLPKRDHLDRRSTIDDADLKFTVQENKTTSKPAKPSPLPSKHRNLSESKLLKTAVSSSVPIPESCLNTRAKPRQVQVLDTCSLKRHNSIESPRLARRRLPIITPRQSESHSLYSENSDLEHSCSYDSLHDEAAFRGPDSPLVSDSPRFRSFSKNSFSRPPSTLFSINDLESQIQNLKTPPKRSGSISVINIKCRRSWIRSETSLEDDIEIEKCKNVLTTEDLILEDICSGHEDLKQSLTSRTHVLKNVVAAMRRSDTERAARMSTDLCFSRTRQQDSAEFNTMRRACQCTGDDLALFQNCLAVLLVDRERLTLPVVTLLIGKIRLTFEILGSDVLRGSVGDMLKLVTGQYGTKIAHCHSSPGMDFRLQEKAEECSKELTSIKSHVIKLLAMDTSPELMALKKTLELFDF